MVDCTGQERFLENAINDEMKNAKIEHDTKSQVRCGEWDTQTTNEPRPHQDRYVANLAIHPEFSSR